MSTHRRDDASSEPGRGSVAPAGHRLRAVPVHSAADPQPGTPLRRSVKALFKEFVQTDARDVPTPGSGETWRRFSVLARWAAEDLSVARLAEGHSDAVAILTEAGMHTHNDAARYGVWAARSRSVSTSATRVAGGWRLSGTKEFCSGCGIIDRALVTADTDEGVRLFDISLEENVVSVHAGSWPAIGMADSASQTVDFGGPDIPDSRVVGPVNFYTNRPGFWFGSAGVAACWYGGSVGLVNHVFASLAREPNEHVLADLGVAASALEGMRAILKETADAIDRDPADAQGQGHFWALIARQRIHDAAGEVLARTGSAGGARPFCHDADQSRRAADLYVYLTQHHGGVDAAELGRLARSRSHWN